MGTFLVVRPEDDALAEQVSEWAEELLVYLKVASHRCLADVSSLTPCTTATILRAFREAAALVLYFGHGNQNSWLTSGLSTLDASNVAAARDKAVVSIACKTGLLLGDRAISEGVNSWLGFTIKVPVLAKVKNADPVGAAFVVALSSLGRGESMQQAHDAIVTEFDQLVNEFDTGTLSGQYNSANGYYAAMGVRDHVVVHGRRDFQPLKDA